MVICLEMHVLQVKKHYVRKSNSFILFILMLGKGRTPPSQNQLNPTPLGTYIYQVWVGEEIAKKTSHITRHYQIYQEFQKQNIKAANLDIGP